VTAVKGSCTSCKYCIYYKLWVTHKSIENKQGDIRSQFKQCSYQHILKFCKVVLFSIFGTGTYFSDKTIIIFAIAVVMYVTNLLRARLILPIVLQQLNTPHTPRQSLLLVLCRIPQHTRLKRIRYNSLRDVPSIAVTLPVNINSLCMENITCSCEFRISVTFPLLTKQQPFQPSP
jgi:hypothetical protein